MCSGGKRVPEAEGPEGQGQARGEGATAMVDALADITGTGTPSSGAMSSPASWLPDRGSLSRWRPLIFGGRSMQLRHEKDMTKQWLLREEGGPGNGKEEGEPGHARLQRLHEKRLREQAAERALAEARKLAEEQEAREWQEELKVLETKRLRLQGEELEKDCLSYFASAEILLKEDVQERSPVTVEEVQPEEEEQRCWHVLVSRLRPAGQRNVTSKDSVESWFRGLLKEPAEPAEPAEPEDSEFNSFGESELQLGHGGALAGLCAALDRSLAEAREAFKAHEAKAVEAAAEAAKLHRISVDHQICNTHRIVIDDGILRWKHAYESTGAEHRMLERSFVSFHLRAVARNLGVSRRYEAAQLI
ncbi:hypothetical protein AK812_SmicGene44303 [Symbiodinium microadriaticum]|uniref:Uncharacterized protein n=1 Tax=Symbiodinium microadriaticum TaxID=2951 RepID=A0A1Q9BZ15_SYMMI|nr:hypothetical protein AK812_SmicGene44303 [Symbiodinium microadriaticum]